ncbi:MAG: CBS domain-containing protein [Chloroflexi bacterium]|nr:CBS domain-containing protein [Chloroflexota bacterium]
MKVRDVMTQHVRCAKPSESVAEVAGEMKRLNVGVMPICEGDKLVGIVTDRDIAIECVAAGLDPRACQVREFMTFHPITISADDDLGQAFRLMMREQVHRLPAVDPGGKLIGILSLGDCAVNCPDDHSVAELVRRVSVPVRSTQPVAAAAV